MDKTNRYSSVPRPRKVLLFIVSIASFVNVILIIVTLVRPTPSFATSVLFRLRSDVEASITRRSLLVRPPGNRISPFLPATPTPVLSDTGIARKDRRSEYWISTGWNVQCKEQDGYMICQDFDSDCGCWRLRPPVLIISTVTHPDAGSGEVAPSYVTESTVSTVPLMPTAAPPEETAAISSSSTDIISHTSSPRAGRIRASISPAATASRSGGDGEADGSGDAESAGSATSSSWQYDFSGLWVGPMGACLEMRNQYRMCTSPSFTPDFTTIYPQSGLPAEVIGYLPKDTNGATVMLLLSCVVYGIAMVSFALAYLPAIRARTRNGNRAYASIRYLWLLALATASTGGGVALAFIAYLLTRRLAASATDNIPQLDSHLFVEGGGSTTPLLITVAFGAFNVLVGAFVMVQDLRMAWRDAVQSYHRREERKANARRKRRWLRRRHSTSSRQARREDRYSSGSPLSHVPEHSQPPLQMPQPVQAQPSHASEPYGQHLRPSDVPISMQRPMWNSAGVQLQAQQPQSYRYDGKQTGPPQGRQKTLWQRVTGG